MIIWAQSTLYFSHMILYVGGGSVKKQQQKALKTTPQLARAKVNVGVWLFS